MSNLELNAHIQQKLIKIFDSSASEIQRKAYLMMIDDKIAEIDVQMFKILNKHGIKDIFEFDEYFKAGKIAESEGWEDFFDLDGLMTEKKELIEIKDKI